jgi:hypothetical protein
MQAQVITEAVMQYRVLIAAWLEKMNWTGMSQLRKGKKTQQNRLPIDAKV